jgi:uncharacterized protein YndB with AHSA1/START domain
LGVDGEYRHMVNTRVDRGERFVAASRSAIFSALTDGHAIAEWRSPEGMQGEIHEFDPRPGGRIRMTLHYLDHNHMVAGKTSEQSDSFEGRFIEIVPDSRVVEEVRFVSSDPAFAEPMIVETVLHDVTRGTKVEMIIRNVPETISPEDHAKGIASSLDNLARFVE